MTEAIIITVCWDCRRARALPKMRRCQVCFDAMSSSPTPYSPGERYDPHGSGTYALPDAPEAPVVPLHLSSSYVPYTQSEVERIAKIQTTITDLMKHGVDTRTILSSSRPDAMDRLWEILTGKKPKNPEGK